MGCLMCRALFGRNYSTLCFFPKLLLILFMFVSQVEEAKAVLDSERSRHQRSKDDLAMSLRVARKKAEVRAAACGLFSRLAGVCDLQHVAHKNMQAVSVGYSHQWYPRDSLP